MKTYLILTISCVLYFFTTDACAQFNVIVHNDNDSIVVPTNKVDSVSLSITSDMEAMMKLYKTVKVVDVEKQSQEAKLQSTLDSLNAELQEAKEQMKIMTEKLAELDKRVDEQECEAINLKEDGTSSYYTYSFLKGYTYDVSISPKSTTSIKTHTKTSTSYIVDTIRVVEGKASFEATDFAYFLNAPASSVVKIIEHKKIEKYDTKKYFPILSSLKRDSNASPNSIVLAHISDIHGSKANLKSFVEFISQYKSIINDAICSGDIVNVEATDSLKFWYDCNAENILTCIGNHDTRIDGDWYAVSELDSYNRFMVGYSNDDGVTPLNPPMYQRWGVILGGNNVCYYHKDYGNLRVITLDCMHYDNSQASWLTSLLASSVDKHVLIVSHVRGENEYTSSGNNFDNLDNNATTTWKQEGAAAIVQSFIDNGGIFIGWICGHTHDDQCGWLKSYPSQFHITISCQKSPSATDEGTIKGVNRMVGGEYQDCINLYSVDTTNKTLRVLRVGVNKDRYMRDITSMIYDYGNNNIIK